ncbi:MAG TPA: YdcF family protein [Longimicrobiaceae bacterium]
MRAARILGWTIFVAALGWGGSVFAIYLFGHRDQARPADAIVVLGAAQYQGRPSPVLRARLDHAIALYRDSIASTLILTGGVGVGDTISEAEVGRRYAVKAGVPSTSILVERTGISTEQSLRAVARLMRERGLHSAVLVSDPFHMLRLRLVASRLGIRPYSSPTRTSPIREGSETEWRFLLRESLILPFVLLGIA